MSLALEDRGATLSNDALYRYLLWRRWDKEKPRALFIMLNPSTADAEVDDPTIRRCIGFARTWGLGGIRVCNLFPFRATDPAELMKADIPEGYGNLGYIEKGVDTGGVSIAAWGAHQMSARQQNNVRNLFYELGVPLYALGVTKHGAPRHPLYLSGSTVPIVYETARNSALAVGDPWAPASRERG